MGGTWQRVPGVVCEGYGVASGVSGEIAGGTVPRQIPIFRERGLDLSHCFPGTLNISIAPMAFILADPRYTFRGVRWSSDSPPEDFSFSPCRVSFEAVTTDGYVYYPHPETKPRHFQAPSVIEVLAPFIEGIAVGSSVTLHVDPREVRVTEGAP